MRQISLVNLASTLSATIWDNYSNLAIAAIAAEPVHNFYEFMDLETGRTLEAHQFFKDDERPEGLKHASITSYDEDRLFLLSRPEQDSRGAVRTPADMFAEIKLRQIKKDSLERLIKSYARVSCFYENAWSRGYDSYAPRLREMLEDADWL